MEIQTIKLDDIYCGNDRQSGGDGNIETLAESIKDVGLINIISIYKNSNARESMFAGGKTYRVIAGKRRFQALKILQYEEASFNVYSEEDAINGDDITLTENINRLEMDPIDEGELFFRLQKKGASVEQLSKKYDRSKSVIYQRTKLHSLEDDYKRLVKEGRLSVTAAAAVVDLPKDVQKKVLIEAQRYGNFQDRDFTRTIGTICRNTIGSKFTCAKCDSCPNRTHYQGNVLFPELQNDQDVCLDVSCYNENLSEWISNQFSQFITQSFLSPDISIAGLIPSFMLRDGIDCKLVMLDGHDRVYLQQLATLRWANNERLQWLRENELTFQVAFYNGTFFELQETCKSEDYNRYSDSLKEDTYKDVLEKLGEKYSLATINDAMDTYWQWDDDFKSFAALKIARLMQDIPIVDMLIFFVVSNSSAEIEQAHAGTKTLSNLEKIAFLKKLPTEELLNLVKIVIATELCPNPEKIKEINSTFDAYGFPCKEDLTQCYTRALKTFLKMEETKNKDCSDEEIDSVDEDYSDEEEESTDPLEA